MSVLVGATFACQTGMCQAQPQAAALSPQAAAQMAATIQVLRSKVQALPQDAKVRFQLGKALRLSGDLPDAASELLEASALDPSLYIAYHEFRLSKPSSAQLDEAIDRLSELKGERPKELMLRVALSELLEMRGDCYDAARALIDLVYENGVPPKYTAQVQARIHYLLSQTKDVQTTESTKSEEAGLDVLPAPLPDATVARSIAANKPKSGDQTPGFGHSTLLP
ncbi:MAG TPA: hypothetical protein V6C69_10120 [Trichormus sp.]